MQPATRESRALSATGESLYILLGIEKGANVEDIKKAYRKKALQCHPDKNPDNPEATEKFKEISKANAVLTDETKRKLYDVYGSVGLELASKIGDDNVPVFLLAQKPWVKILVAVSCILTGCCFGCCCCFCCFMCCGKCKPKEDASQGFDYPEEQQASGDNQGDSTNTPIVTEPRSNTGEYGSMQT